MSSPPASTAAGTQHDLELIRGAGYWLHLTRTVEDAGRNLYLQGRVPGSFYGGRGQEATAVGTALAMGPADIACPHIRDIGVHLVRGLTPTEILMHYMGKASGPLRGREGNVHIGDIRRGTLPMISHLPEILPVGLGVAMARRLRNEDSVAIGLSGEGASSTGMWHEVLNLAAVWSIPFVLVVERNGWSYMTPSDRLLPVKDLSARAAGYGGIGARVDGNDVLAVYRVVAEALDHARSGRTPVIVEAETYRMHGHGAHDPADYVPAAMLERWEQRDPLQQWIGDARRLGFWSEDDQRDLEERVRSEVQSAIACALEAPMPKSVHLESEVFHSG
jgi:TPP-dependent pyruvate/acetoin dehydrogenase alpha subunit